jgi:aquaporin Z
VGISVLGLSSWANIWIYLLADFVGAAAAAGVFKALNQYEAVPEPDSRELSRGQTAAARLASRKDSYSHS